MYLLTCSHCQATVPVSPAQAGDETTCPACGQAVRVPKLGELRQLPEAFQAGSAETPVPVDASMGRTTGFVILGGIATVSLLIAGFCGIRWALIDVPITTEVHVKTLRDTYTTVEPSELIREWESMEKYGVDIASAYTYQKTANEKHTWGSNAAIAGSIGGFSILAAWGLARSGRKPQPEPTH